MYYSAAKASGKLNIVVRDSAGNIKQDFEIPNLVVTSGLSFIASRMKDTTSAAMSHMAIGTGAVAAAAGNTALGSESVRVILTSTTVTANAIAYVASFGPGVGTGAITEAGILNAVSVGTLLCRTVFDVVNKGANDTMQITWTVTLSAA